MSAKKKTASKKPTAKKAAKPAKKAAPKKTAAKTAKKKVATPKKAAPKTAAKKAAAPKKAVKKKATTAKKDPAQKVSAAKGTPKKKGAAKTKKAKAEKSAPSVKKGVAVEEVTRRVTEALRKRGPKTEEEEARKGQPVVFSLADLRDYLKTRESAPVEVRPAPAKKVAAKTVEKPKVEPTAPVRGKQSFGAASVADLLGFDPTASTEAVSLSKSSEQGVPKKFITYFRSLVKLHEEVRDGLNRHSEETLRRSSKEDSGDLSSYGQHMADAGTDSFDRDFALSMVSSEQEALYEIDEAIRRIRDGSYGVCEITEKPISRDRLRAVPFTRYSVEGQIEVEKGRKRKIQKAGIQGFDGDDTPVLSDEDSDD